MCITNGLNTRNELLNIVNGLLKDLLPIANPVIDGEIKDRHLDPWQNVASGTVSPGSIDLGICDATVYANYSVGNFTGLSSMSIDSLVVTNLVEQKGVLVGNLTMAASLGKSFSGSVSGGVGAKCGFIHPSVSLGGTINVSSPGATALGTITVTENNGTLSITAITLANLSAHTGAITVSIHGLGIFDFLIDPIADGIVNLFKPQLLSLLAGQLTPLLNREIASVLPLSS
ncbi:MAG TPA: hypothetical protein VMA74_09895 [Dyella sp.]|uniref:hypothetical protein n=1 Tax=Dyella sp. TaxID=1869338 RepID=UPI002BE96AD7|nr:hypothetical protein [Dyella sp.]HUB90024.1 hypothetical protein [Dyella sp.]